MREVNSSVAVWSYLSMPFQHICQQCTLLTGNAFALFDVMQVRPGIITKDNEGRVKCIPIYSRIVSLFAEQNELQYAVPGGLIGVGLTVDPTLTRADRLVGQVG